MPARDLSKTHYCELCKKPFHPFKGRPGLFCSGICQKKGHKRRTLKTIEFDCQCCGKKTIHPIHWKSPHKFCSIQCMANIRGEKMAGENHPKWKGGSNRLGSGTICKRIKEKIKECQRCGSKDSLQTHHKIPVCERPDLAASPENIEIICVECHAKEHPKFAGMLLKKKTRFAKKCLGCEEEYLVTKAKFDKQKFCSIKCSVKNAKQVQMRKHEVKKRIRYQA